MRRVDEVLGGAKASLEELFRLIHRVNPTGRGGGEERYRRKAALQSLLIREHASALGVEPTDDPDIVSLRHVLGRRDACHARLSALDDDARSWARLQLDGWESPETAAPFAAVAGGESALTAGRRALAEYDYDTAESCFRAALATDEAPQAAEALLELLVDHLCRDEDALELHLGRSARASTTTRRLLARAALRAGRLERAGRLLDGLGDAELLADLANALLQADRLVDARQAALRARDLAPASGSVRAAVEAVGHRERAQDEARRRPAEDELRQLAAARDWSRLEAHASAAAKRFPRSTVARELLEQAVRERRRVEAASEAERARELELRRQELARRRRAAEDRALEDALGRGIDEALAVWLGFTDRARHRDLFAGEPLSHLEALAPHGTGAEVVAALRAFAAGGGPASLRAHRAVLRHHPPYQAFEEAERRRQDAERQALARRRAELAHEKDKEKRRAAARREWDRAVQDLDWLRARKVARDNGWSTLEERAERELREDWRWLVIEGAPYPDTRELRPAWFETNVNRWIVGDEVFLVSGPPGPLLEIRRAKLGGETVSTLLVELPIPVQEHTSCHAMGDRLVIPWGDHVLVLEHSPWAIVAFLDLRELLGDVGEFVDCMGADGGRLVWVRAGRGEGSRSWVVDVDQGRMIGRAEGGRVDYPLPDGRRVARCFDDHVELVHVRTATGSGRFDGANPRGVTLGPRKSWVALLDTVDDHGREQLGVAFVMRGQRATIQIDGSVRSPRAQFVARPDGAVWCLGPSRTGDDLLLHMEFSGTGIRQRWTCAVPANRSLLVHDDTSTQGAFLIFHLAGIHLVPLGEAPPELPPMHSHRGGVRFAPPFDGFLSDPHLAGRRATATEDDPVGCMLRDVGGLDEPLPAIDALIAELPREPLLGALRVWALAEEERWTEVLAQPLELTELPRGTRMHCHFIRACAHVRTGDLQAGYDEVQVGQRVMTVRGLEDARHILAVLLDLPGSKELVEDDPALLEGIVRIREADAALGRGEPAAAVEALDRPSTWTLSDPQMLARLAIALTLVADDDVSRMRARLAGAALFSAIDQVGEGLPLGPDEYTLDELMDARDEALDA